MILLMIIAVLLVLGICFGSFVNALVWRIHEQEELNEKIAELKAKTPQPKSYAKQLAALTVQKHDRSISTGRSMCVHCHHTLAWYDLLPVFSWLSLKGKCRYCNVHVSWQYPVVEIFTAAIFAFSYLHWPQALNGQGIFNFSVWLVALVAFMALAVYDIRWMILPNRVVYPLIALAASQRFIDYLVFGASLHSLVNNILAAIIGGGIFFVLYQLSDGNWIGGGDVKLGYALGFFVGTPLQGLLLLMLASTIGIIGAVPTIFKGRFKRNLQIPFGPCLLLACFILVLFGAGIVNAYLRLLTP